MPLVVSYGMGVDSTAMLVALHQRRVRPDLILFADTGGEKPETYAYYQVIEAWLRRVGFPSLTIVKYKPKTAPYDTLEGNCLANETLPSLAYGVGSCSQKFKGAPQDRFVRAWQPAIATWAAGGKVTKAIGYDNGERDRQRAAKALRAIVKTGEDKRYAYWFPLQEYGIDREACDSLIERAGLPVPPKSACFFCPSSKKAEIIALRDNHPGLFARALAIEERSRTGRHGFRTVKGLGRQFAWADVDQATDQPETLRP